MRKSTKEKIFRKAQSTIQNTYMGLFVTGCYFLAFFKKFGTWYEFRYVVAVVIICGILTTLKAKTFLSKRKNRKWLANEIDKAFRSENGIEL